ncbi:MAG TPA: hypothetical protein VGW34_11850 [Allosphingosinicella sp.]|nr:hypothetical protein [Allosphingosinicella sp.]
MREKTLIVIAIGFVLAIGLAFGTELPAMGGDDNTSLTALAFMSSWGAFLLSIAMFHNSKRFDRASTLIGLVFLAAVVIWVCFGDRFEVNVSRREMVFLFLTLLMLSGVVGLAAGLRGYRNGEDIWQGKPPLS